MDSEGILSEAQDESIKSKNYETRVDYSQKIKELQDALDKEISELENINYDDIQDDEIQKQNKEIEILKKQIEENNIENDYNECEEQFKIFDNFKKDLENNFNSYEKLINKEINDLKTNLKIQINKQFEDIISGIKEIIKNPKNINKQINVENEHNPNFVNEDNINNSNYYDKGIIHDSYNFENKINNKDNNIESPDDSDLNSNNKNMNQNSSDKESNNKNQDINNVTFNNSRISKQNIKRKKNNNNNSNYENQNNGKKNENINYDEQFKGLDENNINSFEKSNDIIENSTCYFNTFLRNNNNNNNLNMVGNNPNNKKKIGYTKKTKEEPYKIKNNYNNNNEVNYRNDKPKISNIENDDQKLYQRINSIFFIDYQQKYIKDQKINEYKKEELQKAIFNDKVTGRNILKNYYMNFIEENILPLFRRNRNISQSKLEVIKYNISTILECLGMDKNYYNNYFYQYEINKQKIPRRQSQEAVLRFRKEFNISKEDYTDEALERRLIENNLDTKKTFGKMFG